jgi:hypothetical protein
MTLGILRSYNGSWLCHDCNFTAINQLTYTRNIPSAVCVVPSEDEQGMLETCRGS